MVASDRTLLDVDRAGEAERAQEQLLVERALLGETAAFRGLVERHQRGVHGLVGRLVRNTSDQDELVQEAFARAYCALEQFDPRYRFSTWLYRIALNLCRDHNKSAKRREHSVGLDVEAAMPAGAPTQPSHEMKPDRDTELARLRVAIDLLSDKDREVIVLKDLHELSYEEIRELTGSPITALKIRVVRARRRLQGFMQGGRDGA
jgi:RNA polymerase sigma-70 factor (ECF subfamily)